MSGLYAYDMNFMDLFFLIQQFCDLIQMYTAIL